MSCNGNGVCLKQCFCECSDCSKCGQSSEDCKCECNCDEDDCICYYHIMREICTCSHRVHNGYCNPEFPCLFNCVPKLCPNNQHHIENKDELFPEWYFDCHGGNCYDCAIKYGHGFKNTDIYEECQICFENKLIIKLQCNHGLCWNCWVNMCQCEKDTNIRASCPFCRKNKW
jgi:hypothetical protein